MRGPKGFKKGFLLQPETYGTEDGEDTSRGREESGCFSDKRSDSGSEVGSNSGFVLDGLNFINAFKRAGVSEEFLVNQMEKRIQEYFLNESDKFLGISPPVSNISGRLKRRKARRPGRNQRVE